MNKINISSSNALVSKSRAKKHRKHKDKYLNFTKKSLLDRFLLIQEEKGDKIKDQMNMYLFKFFIFLNRIENSSKSIENDAGKLNIILINEHKTEDPQEENSNKVYCLF